jgi:hypothetical protein
MGVPASITNRVRAKPSESSLFFVLWSQNRHLWGIGDTPRDHSALGVSCRQAFPYRITEGLPVIFPESMLSAEITSHKSPGLE